MSKTPSRTTLENIFMGKLLFAKCLLALNSAYPPGVLRKSARAQPGLPKLQELCEQGRGPSRAPELRLEAYNDNTPDGFQELVAFFLGETPNTWTPKVCKIMAQNLQQQPQQAIILRTFGHEVCPDL